jgi:hypothetical protein
MAKRVVKLLKQAAPSVFTIHAAVSLTSQETFRVYIEVHFGPGLGLATCIYRTFEGWPAKEAIASIGREIEAPYQHILSFCAYLRTTKEQWYLDDNVVVVLGCEITAKPDGKLALESFDPVTDFGNLRKVILMLRRGYPLYLKKMQAALSPPKDQSIVECPLNLV